MSKLLEEIEASEIEIWKPTEKILLMKQIINNRVTNNNKPTPGSFLFPFSQFPS